MHFNIGRITAAAVIGLPALALCMGFSPSSRCGAADPQTTANRPPAADSLTVDDVLSMERAADFVISPDGKWLAWVRMTPNREKNERVRTIQLSSLSDTTSVAVTRGPRRDSSPRFSPDGTILAFLRAEEKSPPQICLYRMRGGEPEKLTSVKTGVRSFAWRSGEEILYTAREDSTLRETRLAKAKDDAVVAADQEHYAPVRLWSIALAKREPKRVTTNAGEITEFAISPDGRLAVTAENQHVDYEYDFRVPPKQFLVDLETGERREICSEPFVDPSEFAWDDTGAGFYCLRSVASDSTDAYVSIRQLYYFDIAGGRLRPVPLEWDKGIGGRCAVVKGGVVVSLADGVWNQIAFAERTKSGWRKTYLVSKAKKPMAILAGSRAGRTIVFASSDAASPPEYLAAEIHGGKLANERVCLKLNEPLRKKPLARREIVRWKGALGESVEGILYYPVGWAEGKQYPLVVSIHGGPSGADMDFFDESWGGYPHLLANRGAFTLNVNYHGSGNYGLPWVESIKGHYYEYEVPDILAGVDYAVERGLADPGRLAVMGWSNGAILSIECCLETDRFKALCAGAGDVNWTSDYGNCAFGAAFDNAYFGGPPWERPDVYVAKSPLFRMKNLKTPALVMFGTEDVNVPTEQGWEQFRAMQQIGTTPVRFILFPGEPHGLGKISHQRRKMEEELAWLDRHLFRAEKPKNEAFDENSPLALELKKASFKRSGALYGETVNGVLIPETVKFLEMKIGRFEVTRAQYRAFDPAYECAPGMENFPASGVTLEKARKYCEWLSARTGRRFRLPTAAEMGKLIEAAKPNLPNENNLDRWLGYSPSPDELAMLEPRIAELEAARTLLEEVGSGRPIEPACVYDLGGNASELSSDGAMGISVLATRDGRSVLPARAAAYAGFRVVDE